MAPVVQRSGERSVAGRDAVVLDQYREQVQDIDRGQGHVDQAPPPRDREQDGAEAEEWEEVALVGPGRDDEEGDGQDGQGHQQRLGVVAPGGPGADSQENRHQQAVAQDCRVYVLARYAEQRNRSGDCGPNQERAPQTLELGEQPACDARTRRQARALRTIAVIDRGLERTFLALARRPRDDARQQEERSRDHGHDDDRRGNGPDQIAHAALPGAGVGPGRVVEHPPLEIAVERVTLTGREQGPGVVGVQRQERVLAEGAEQVAGDRVEDHAREGNDGAETQEGRSQRPSARLGERQVPPPEREDPEASDQPARERGQPGRRGYPARGTYQVETGERQTDQGGGDETGAERAQNPLRLGRPILGHE